MDVRLGYTIDLGGRWGKADIGVDESDLQAWLHEYGIPVDFQLTTTQKYKILAGLGEKLILVHQITNYPDAVGEFAKNDLRNVSAALTKLASDLQSAAGQALEEARA